MHRFFTGLGKFTVKYRWIILAVWLVGTFAAVKALPSLSSQVNNDNSAFLPANAPDVKAANLAAPLVGKESLAPIVVVADRISGPLTAADVTAVEREVNLLKGVTNVKQVLFLGTSPNGRAVQIEALADVGGFGIQAAQDSINATVGTFGKAGAPPGLQFHVAGQIADDVAQNAASKNSGNQVQSLSLLFIIILLFLIFRSVLAPFVTLIPAALVLQLAGSFIGALGTHGLKISGVTQLLLIVIVLGAGTDYGLFLVFRVREGLRSGMEPKEAVALAVSRVGESISASAGTVILALVEPPVRFVRHLSRPRDPARRRCCHDARRWPDASACIARHTRPRGVLAIASTAGSGSCRMVGKGRGCGRREAGSDARGGNRHIRPSGGRCGVLQSRRLRWSGCCSCRFERRSR